MTTKKEKYLKKKEILKSYIEAKMELNKAKKVVDAQKKNVIKVLLKVEDHTVLVDGVSIYLRRNTKYEYSKKVAFKEEALEADKEVLGMMKKDEVLDGTAEPVSETFTPVVK